MKTKSIKCYFPSAASDECKKEMAKININMNDDKSLRQFFITSRSMVEKYLSGEIRLMLDDVKNNRIVLPPYILIRNVPIDDIEKVTTPLDGFLSNQKETQIAEAFQIGVCQLIGQPYSFIAERRHAGISKKDVGRLFSLERAKSEAQYSGVAA